MRSLIGAVCGIAVVAVLVLASEGRAQAVPPEACGDDAGLRMFSSGVVKGESLVNQSWASAAIAKQRASFDVLKREVLRAFASVALPANASHSSVCQYLGVHEGVLLRIAELNAICVKQCGLDGEFVGDLAALMYCELSAALGGLGLDVDLGSGPPTTCETAFEEACMDEFAVVTTHFQLVNSSINCRPYTTDAFVPVWSQTMYNQCLFDPFPPSDG